MMMKLMLITTRDVIHEVLQAGSHIDGAHGALIGGETFIFVVRPRHFGARFELAKDARVMVLPGVHDPTPIGATIAGALSHVNAKPTETMREVALRLHAVHGPAYHPDV